MVHFCFDTRRKTCERRPLPGKLRVQSAGAIYHVMSRGDRRENVFPDDVDRQDFLKTLAETCQETGFQVHAYCLMPNHFHLVVETPDANLVAGVCWVDLGTSKSANSKVHQWMRNKAMAHLPPDMPAQPELNQQYG